MECNKKLVSAMVLALSLLPLGAQNVDYSVVSVREESGLDLQKITSDNDQVAMPLVRRSRSGVNWVTNRILNISPDGGSIAFISARGGTSNIFVKDLDRQGASIQRTNRSSVTDFSYSPDGKYICFSEAVGRNSHLFQTDAKQGFVCRQITSGNRDFSPAYTKDMSRIFFAREENRGVSIWSYDVKNNFLSSYSSGMNPSLIGNSTALCARTNAAGKGEIWKVDYNTGVEECLVSDLNISFSTPVLSPDGQWVAFVGGSQIINGNISYWNTDIYVCRIDGSERTQLTYHAADDLSPAWSMDGRCIYFISQRGSADGIANIWRISFAL